MTEGVGALAKLPSPTSRRQTPLSDPSSESTESGPACSGSRMAGSAPMQPPSTGKRHVSSHLGSRSCSGSIFFASST